MSQVWFNIQMLSSLINSNSEHTRLNHRRLFTSGSWNPNVFGFEKTVDVFEHIVIRTKTQSLHRALSSSHLRLSCEQGCTVLPSSETTLSTDQVHVIKLPDVGNILSSVHALDQSANFVFATVLTILCRKFDVNKSLGCSLEMCSTDVVVSQLQWFPFVPTA